MKIQQSDTSSYSIKRSAVQSFKKLISLNDVDKLLRVNDNKIKAIQGQTPFISGYLIEKERTLVTECKRICGFYIPKSEYRMPKNPARVLWSNLKEMLTQKHAENKNDIILDSFTKDRKNYIEISVFDAKKNKIHEEIVEPKVEKNTLRNLFPEKDHDFSAKNFIISRFFDALERAEHVADELHLKDINKELTKKTSLKLIPKEELGIKKSRLTEAKIRKINAKKHKKEVETYQKSVELIAEMLKREKNNRKKIALLIQKNESQQTHTQRERIPRKQKKLMSQPNQYSN